MFKIETVSAMKVTVDIRQAIKEGLIDPDEFDDLEYFLKLYPTVDIFGYVTKAIDGDTVLEVWYQPKDYGHIEFAIGIVVKNEQNIKGSFISLVDSVLEHYIQWNEIE